MPDIVIIAPTA